MLEDIRLYNVGGEWAGTLREAGDAKPALDETARLKLRIGALELAVETLTRLILQSGQISEGEFYALVQKIDAEDGVLDGQRDLGRMRKVCSNCSRACSPEKQSCIWCGADISLAPLEQLEL